MKRIVVVLLRVLVVCSALNLQFSIALAQGTGFTLLTTITNPTPAYEDHFGNAVAAVGNDRVLIGARSDNTGAANAGAAYLFSTNGVLLTTFTNPTPAAFENFGISVTAVGSDRVLIGALDDTGATNAGAAYLFTTNGVLLTTFTNPTPAVYDYFGNAVAAVGNDRVLIGAYHDSTGATRAGAAYLFNTDGVLLTTFTNPTPAADDNFGNSVATVGNDLILIGAANDDTGANSAGVVYLFNLNGLLLNTFTNPAPTNPEYFGNAIAAFGPDRVLIGANYNTDDLYPFVGAAYLFSTNGALLTTFTNPTPYGFDTFGDSVTAVGSDRVLIGASLDDTIAADAGMAYLFSTNGVLLATCTNLPLASYDFGSSVAALGNDAMLIGAPGSAGVVYLLSAVMPMVEAPLLTIGATATNTAVISWPSPATGWTLQQNTNDVSSINWSNAPGPIQDDGTNKTLIVNPPTGNRFYRLFKP